MWWWWRENSRNVVGVVVVEGKQWKCGGGGGAGRKQWNFMTWKPIKMRNILPLSQSKFCSRGVDVSWLRSVCQNPLVEKIVCKGTWCVNTARLVSPHFKHFQCFHRNVSGFASSISSPPWLPEWPGPEKRPGFDLYCSKLHRPFTIPWRRSLGVIHNGSRRIQKC